MMKTPSRTKLVIIILCFVFIVVSDAVADADLRFDYVTVSRRATDSLYYRGDLLSIAYEVRNIGDTTSSDFTVDFYAGDYFIWSVEGPYPFAAGEYTPSGTTFAVPDTIPYGDYQIWGRVTCENDGNSENNTATDTRHISIKESQVTHLIVTSVSVPSGVYRPGDLVDVTVEMEAYGGQLSAEYDINYYASLTDTVSGDYHMGADSGSLAPHGKSSFTTTCEFPEAMPEGNYCIEAVVTWQGLNGPKSDQAKSFPLVVGAHPEADLKVISIDPVEGTYGPGEEITVYSLVQNIGALASGSYTIDYYASVDTSVSTNDYHLAYVDRSHLEAGGQHSYNTNCCFPANIREGTYYIGAIVQPSQADVDLENNRACSTVTVDIAPSARYVGGQLQYRNYGTHPIRYARVEIYEDDQNNNPLDDPLIMETYTDHVGYYGILLPEAANDEPDIYVRVFAEGAENAYPETTSKICTVKDDVLSEIYFMESPLYPYPHAAALVIDMTAVESGGGGEFMVYDSVVEGFHQARTFFGIELAEITTFWPSADGSYYDPCDYTIHISRDDRRDRDIIMHEYGHYVADFARFGQGSVGDYPAHYWDRDLRHNPVSRTDEEARNLAFRESWASLFSVATQHGDTWDFMADSKYQDLDEASGDTFSVDLERDTVDHDSPGEFYENMNCCALWDVFDDFNFSRDDNDVVSDVSLTKIWTICLEYRPDDIIDFWNGWIHHFPDEQTEDMMRIFEDHKMPFVRPKAEPNDAPNRAPVAVAGEDQTLNQTYIQGASVHLDASESYDPDGDELLYRWYLDAGTQSMRTQGLKRRISVPVGVSTVTLEVYDGEAYGEDTITVTVLPTDPEDWLF